MIKINFFKDENNVFTKLEVSGHAGYSDHGSDIVCAAVSAIVQAGGMGILKVLNINADKKQNDNDGYYLIELPKNISETKKQEAQILFETMYLSLKDIQKGYSKFIKLEVK